MPAAATVATTRKTYQRNRNSYEVRARTTEYVVTVIFFSCTVTGNVFSHSFVVYTLSTAKTRYSVILYSGSSVGHRCKKCSNKNLKKRYKS